MPGVLGWVPQDPQLTSPVPAEQDWGPSSLVERAQGLTVPGEGTAPALRVLQPPRAEESHLSAPPPARGTAGLALEVTTGPGSWKVPAKVGGCRPGGGAARPSCVTHAHSQAAAIKIRSCY